TTARSARQWCSAGTARPGWWPRGKPTSTCSRCTARPSTSPGERRRPARNAAAAGRAFLHQQIATRITAAPEYIVNTARLIGDVRVVRCKVQPGITGKSAVRRYVTREQDLGVAHPA